MRPLLLAIPVTFGLVIFLSALPEILTLLNSDPIAAIEAIIGAILLSIFCSVASLKLIRGDADGDRPEAR